ncbi:MAG: hypothetical protein N3G19_02180 [Candidatus Pacearchaeota archaeon]|nr:hypothetical protein [Candidatus Pacearchaeota archaeon]
MAVYVKLEVDEAIKTREAITNAQETASKVELKGLEFERIRNEKKRNSTGIISRIREIENEIRKIEAMLPKESLEMLKTLKPIKQQKSAIPSMKSVKPVQLKKPLLKTEVKKTKKEIKKDELLKIKKQLEELEMQ